MQETVFYADVYIKNSCVIHMHMNLVSRICFSSWSSNKLVANYAIE